MPAATMPQRSARACDDAGGSTATTTRRSGGASVARAILDQFAIEFLPSQSRARVASDNGVDELWRQIGAIHQRGGPRHGAAAIGQNALDDRTWPRRRCNDLTRMPTQPQAELQHVETLLTAPPFAQFIEPGAFELGTAERLGVFGGEQLRDRAVGPDDPPSRRREDRSLLASMRAQNAGNALNHYIAHIGHGFTDQRDAHGRFARETRQAQRDATHPLGAGARLARAASAQNKPLRPFAPIGGARGRQLIGPGEGVPAARQKAQMVRLQRRQNPSPRRRTQRREQVFQPDRI